MQSPPSAAATDLHPYLDSGRAEPAFAHETTLCRVPEGEVLVATIDTLVADVHFFADAPPADVGHKALAVNLSDLAAMGAVPTEALLSVTAPAFDPAWLRAFGEGFGSLARAFSLRQQVASLRRGPLTVTVQAFGHAPAATLLTRAGARPGDLVYVTGTLGDAGLALEARVRSLDLGREDEAFVERRLARPEPRIAAGLALRGVASAAIDISDGLAADLGHILEAAGVGATIRAADLPLSSAMSRAVEREDAWRMALCTGDDYELCVTVPPERVSLLEKRRAVLGCPIRAIGCIETQVGLRCRREDGTAFAGGSGYRHF